MLNKREKKSIYDNAQLMATWNWKKNEEVGFDPHKLTSNSGKKAWWICNKGHEWQATIGSRNGGCGCPYCSGRFAISGKNDLQTVNPSLAKEWNYERNGDLTPRAVLPNSIKMVWWIC